MRPAEWLVGDGRRISLVERPAVMGILNVTPDSFSDGALHFDRDDAIAHGIALVEAGADIVDVGGESTRPGAEAVEVATELERVVPVVRSLADRGVTVSVDTSKPEVARAALEVGAAIVNDVTGFRSPEMVGVVAEGGAGAVVMHMQGTPRTMQTAPSYDDVVADVERFLLDRANALVAAGVDGGAIALDPGIGFGKTIEHNLALIGATERFAGSGFPILIGVSRKSFLGTLAGGDEPRDRDPATTVVNAVAMALGAAVIRVHDAALGLMAASVVGAIVAP